MDRRGLRKIVPAAGGLIALAATARASFAGTLLGQTVESAEAGVTDDLLSHVVMALVFGLMGMVLFGIFLFLVVKIAPFSVRKEIEEDQNVALGIIVGSMILGIAMIISAAILG